MRLFGRGRAAGEADVLVTGAGLAPAVVALALARRRLRVTLVEPPAEERRLAAALGVVCIGPALPYAGVIAALGRSAARLVWAAGRENRDLLRGFLAEGRRSCGYRERGSFLLADEREMSASLAESEDLLREDGFGGEFLDHYMLETRFDVTGCTGAYWAADDAEVDARALAAVVRDAARAAGATFHGGRLIHLEAEGPGVAAHTERGPLRAERGVVATDGLGGALLPLVSGLRPAESAVARFTLPRGARLPAAARAGGRGMAWQVEGTDVALVGGGGVEALAVWMERLPAGPGRRQLEATAGEATPDGLPLVGSLPGSPLSVVCGLGALPASLAFFAARAVAEAIGTGHDPTPAPLRAARALLAGPGVRGI